MFAFMGYNEDGFFDVFEFGFSTPGAPNLDDFELENGTGVILLEDNTSILLQEK